MSFIIVMMLIKVPVGQLMASVPQPERLWWFPGEHLDEFDRQRLRELVNVVPFQRLRLWTKSASLPLAMQPLNLHYVRNGSDEALLLDGDFRWLVRDLSTFENLSSSPHIGFNYGAYHFLHAGHLFSFGGSGFWNAHNQLLVFSDQTRGFEWVTSGHPEMSRIRDQQVFKRGDELVCFQHVVPSGKGEDEVEIWTKPPTGGGWRYGGTFELGGGEWTSGLDYFELEDYVLFPNINRGVRVVRKRDFAFLEIPVHPLGMATQSGQMRLNRNGTGWGVTADAVYRVEDWQLTDTLFHVSELPVGAMWSMPHRTADQPEGDGKTYAELGWERGKVAWWMGAVGAILLGLVGWGVRRCRRSRFHENSSNSAQLQSHSLPSQLGSDEDALQKILNLDRWSPYLLEVVHAAEGAWEVDAFARMLGLDPSAHPETLRSQRARIFQQINEESTVVLGYSLLSREKHPRDARSVLYRRAPIPRFVTEAVDRYFSRQEMPSDL